MAAADDDPDEMIAGVEVGVVEDAAVLDKVKAGTWPLLLFVVWICNSTSFGTFRFKTSFSF